MSGVLKYNEMEEMLIGKTPKVSTKSSHDELRSLINLGSNGVYPLFYREWVQDSFKTKVKHISYKDAKSSVKAQLARLQRHRSLDRKKTALMQLSNEERSHFIQSFIRLVEFNIIDNTSEIH
ncbi:MAG: hypothetical protein ACI9QD_000809 [Thermoproteota archaeon]|jgi:hypothetical protein